MTAERRISAAILRLVVNYIVVYTFCGSAADVIHLLHPNHLIFSFELFRYIFFFGKLFYQPEKHFFCLFVNISVVTVKLMGTSLLTNELSEF